MPSRLFTSDKQIRLMPDEIKADLSRIDKHFKSNQEKNIINKKFNMQLIGRRDPRTNNSWMHNSHRLVKGKNRCIALINPLDAKNNNLKEGDMAEVFSAVGKITLPISITEKIKAGVVSIPHGWGHVYEGLELSIAKKNPGVNVNILMDDGEIDELSGNAVLSGVPISIQKV